MNKTVKQCLLLLVLATGALALTILAENCVSLPFCEPPSAHAAERQTISFPVEGMTCGACKLTVQTVLKRLDGVQDVKVSYKKKKATVSYDPQQVTPEQMIQAINKTGRYQATLPPR